MACGVFTIKKVPEHKLAEVVADFADDDPPPLQIEKVKDNQGTFTVIATYKPCPANTTHDSAIANG
jgi:hypothetical protein